MAAQPSERWELPFPDLAPSPRRFTRDGVALPDLLPFPPVGTRYTLDSSDVPFPASVSPFLRADAPGRHWARVLRAIFDKDDAAGYDARQVAAMQTIGGLLARNARDDRALRYVRMLVPVVPCAWCGRDYLRESKRRLHCSDVCRRVAAAPLCAFGSRGPMPPRLLDCARCGRPVTGRRRAYCSEQCERVTNAAISYARRRAQRAVAR